MLTVLSIAGFDPSGGAGILADIKTFAAFGCFGTAAITSLTSQNTVAVYGAYHQTPEIVRAQIEPILSDFDIAAVKTGMLPTRETIALTADIITQHRLSNVVVDPVIRSTSGYDLIDDAAVVALREKLLPLASVITPNLAEAERLTGQEVKNLAQMKYAAAKIHEACYSAPRTPRSALSSVLVKGGHLDDESVDVLYDGSGIRLFHGPKIASRNTHGTGCTLSSAIAACLAQGSDLSEAVQRAKAYVTEAISSAPHLGHGAGPLNHFF